jgi:hypothetical protein
VTRRVVSVVVALLGALLLSTAVLPGVASAQPFGPQGELTCHQLFQKLDRDQNRLARQEKSIDRTKSNIKELGSLIAGANNQSESSFFQSQLQSQLSLLKAQEENLLSGEVIIAQDEALLIQQGCNTA